MTRHIYRRKLRKTKWPAKDKQRRLVTAKQGRDKAIEVDWAPKNILQHKKPSLTLNPQGDRKRGRQRHMTSRIRGRHYKESVTTIINSRCINFFGNCTFIAMILYLSILDVYALYRIKRRGGGGGGGSNKG